jgi:cathepsin L
MYYLITAFSILLSNMCSAHDAMSKFSDWVAKHRIQPKDDFHLAHMFSNWVDNDKYIQEVNARNLSYTLGHNAYSGMNLAEFSEFMGLQQAFSESSSRLRGTVEESSSGSSPIVGVPTSVDWRTKGAVTPVKDQGQCGSCYSFSNTGALEGAHQIKYGNLISLSEQQIVDCSTLQNGGPNMGCNGGQIQKTMGWEGKNGGLCLESAYPYTSGTTKTAGSCQRSCTVASGTKVVSSTAVPANSDSAMMAALALQPVSVAVEADQRDFQLYSGDVFTGSCGTSLDHAVLLVGYGVYKDGLEYYILKNSWGTSWGVNGYMLIGKNTDPNTGKPYNGGKGQCGVLMEGAYPNL